MISLKLSAVDSNTIGRQSRPYIVDSNASPSLHMHDKRRVCLIVHRLSVGSLIDNDSCLGVTAIRAKSDLQCEMSEVFSSLRECYTKLEADEIKFIIVSIMNAAGAVTEGNINLSLVLSRTL